MSYAGIVADLAGTAVDAYGAAYVRGMLPSLIRTGVSNGLSGAEILRQLRSAGAGIQTQRFYQALGEVQASEISAAGVAGMDLTTVPSEEMFAAWGVRNPTGYVYQFRMYIGETMEDGSLITAGYRNFSLRTNGVQAVGEILQDAIDLFRNQATRYGQAFLGAEVANLYKEVGLK